MIDPHSFSRVNERDLGSFGWFALVCYVPDPQRSCLDAVRQFIPGRPLPPVHVTVLPPRPLRALASEACLQVERVAREFPAFEVQLSEVRHFPETDFLYLDIAEGNSTLCDVHRTLAVGELEYSEAYVFRPHLTLGGPVPPGSLPAVQQRISEEWKNSNCPRRVVIEELACLWLSPNAGGKPWERYNSVILKGMKSRQGAAPG